MPAAAGGALAAVAAFLLLLLGLLFGGGTTQYHLSDLVVQLAAVLIAAAALPAVCSRWSTLSADRRQLLALGAAVLLVMLLQLLPLPANWWASLPGRDELAANHAQLGLPAVGWWAWSTEPDASLASLRALLPAFALLLVGVLLDDRSRARLLWLPLLVALLSVPFGLLQVAQGADSALRFYTPTNHHEAVGLFANRNHLAALLYCGVALAFGCFLALDHRLAGRGPLRAAHAVGWLVLVMLLLLGALLTRSRAGMALGLLGVLVMALHAVLQWRGPRRGWLLGGVALAVLLALALGYGTIAHRVEADWLADHRWQVSAVSFQLAADFGWLGAGAGSFPAAYAAFEPVDLVGDKIINHAHNDWFELLVDLGLAFVALALGFLVWLYRRIREQRLAGWPTLAMASMVALTLLMLHSTVDYPLRTTALMLVAVGLCLQLLRPLEQSGPWLPAAPRERRRRRSASRTPITAR